MQLFLVFGVFLPLTCAIRITVKECPVNKTSWRARERVFVCISPNVYHCIQDEESILMETCMPPYRVRPLRKGGCPWALHTASGETIIGAFFNPCTGTGCPKTNDPEYWTNELYKYPICLHHDALTSTQNKVSKTSDPLVLNNNESVSAILEISHESEEDKKDPAMILGVFIGIMGMVGVVVIIIVAVRCYRRKIRYT